jgi:osmotically-inducible protein OsmY
MADTSGDREPGWITTKIRAQYWVNPEIRPWNIDVTTSNGGVVTLSGRVDETADRDEAVRIARGTDGVTDVRDRLTVGRESNDTAAMTQPDAWITAKIQAQYFMDADVKGRDINVDTRDGAVTLRGTIDSEAERRQALMIARNTDGVRSVDDQLTIGAAQAGDARGAASSAGATVEDAWITTKLQSKYFLDPQIKGSTIDVTTRRGVVTLEGSVATSDLKEQAAQIARETGGVTRVDNQLKIAATTR